MHNKIISELREQLTKQKDTLIAIRSANIRQGVADKILDEIKKKYNLKNNEQLIAVLAAIFQQGGTARSCDGNMTVTIFEQQIKLADIKKF